MKILNNKYSIINSVDVNENLYLHEVKDIFSNKKYNLFIFKENIEYESCRNYLLSKFKTIKNLNFKNVVNILKIEVIKSIDKVYLNKLNYGYITENIEKLTNIEGYFNDCSFLEKIDLFMELCTAVNTLNIKGYIFNEISIKDIDVVLDEKNKPIIKIRNLLQYEISKFKENNKITYKSIPYPDNIETIYDESCEKDNLEEILYLFKNLFKESDLEEFIEKGISFEKIFSLKKLNKITDFIKWINNKLNKNYDLFVFEVLNNINTDLDIIGMEAEINKVELDFKSICENKQKYKIICFQGEDGNGKTKVLYEIKKRICSKYVENKKEDSYVILDNLSNDKELIKNLQKKFNGSEKFLKEKYYLYLEKFISMFLNKNILINKKTFQIINRICSLVHEYTLNNKLILIIDDIEKTSEVFKLFIKYLCVFESKLENILIILSSNEENFSNYMIEHMNSIKKMKNYEEVQVNYFNNYNTSEMVKSMLNYNKSIDDLCMKIYSETLGKPQFIYKTIEELYNKKTLYLSKEDGRWKSNIGINKIVIPKEVEKILENKILNLNIKQLDVLQRLSIYKRPLSEELIYSYVITDNEKQNIYLQLKNDRILIDKISDEGVKVDLYNDLVKKIIYSKIAQEKKIRMHNNSCCFFENVLKNTQEYLDEFLNQLEKSNQTEKLIKYSLKSGKKFDDLGNIFKSIDYYKKALTYAPYKKRTTIAISIAKLNEKVGRERKAYKYFNKSNEYAVKNEQTTLQIYSLLRLIIINIKERRIIDLKFPLKAVRDLLNEVNYPKGEAYYYYAFALISKIHGEKDEAIKYLERVFEICNINNIKIGVYACAKLLLSKIMIENGKYSYARQLSNAAMKIFEFENNYAGLLTCKINYEQINIEVNSNIDDILNNFIEIKKLSNKYKIYKKEVVSLIEISKIHIETFKYEEACKNLLVALEIARKNDFTKYILKIYTLLCYGHCKLGQIKVASYYYEIISDLKNNIYVSEFDMLTINSSEAFYNITTYNLRGAFDKLKIIGNIKNKYNGYEFNKIKSQYYQLNILNCNNEREVKNNFILLKKQLSELENPILKDSILMWSIILILFLGYKELAKELFFDIKNYSKEYNNQLLYYFLALYFIDDNNQIINNLLNIIKSKKDDELKGMVYYSIGSSYKKKKNFELAINYYYESINVFIKLINDLPENIKLQYINNSLFLAVYNGFIDLINNKININICLSKIDYMKSICEFNEILNKLSISNLMLNNKFLNMMEDLYSTKYNNPIKNFNRILHGFSNDIIKNLDSLLKYIARVTLANKALIVIEDDYGKGEAICNLGIKEIEKIKKYISLKSECNKEITTLCNNYNYKNSFGRELFKDKIQACMYIKLKNKKKIVNNNECINGSIILMSDNSINNINNNSQNAITNFIPFITFLLNQYKIVISSKLDKLTGVYNRKYLENVSCDLMGSCYFKEKNFSLIIFDIDDFKGVNDRFGHQTGDEVLIYLTKEVKKCLTKEDIFIRYGGEEFIILLPDKCESMAFHISEKIRKKVEDAKILGEKREVTISLGISVYQKHATNLKELIKMADKALYISKAQGKNKTTIWNQNIDRLNNNHNTSREILLSKYNKDNNFILIVKDIIELLAGEGNKENKIKKFLSRIVTLTDSESAIAFVVKNKKIISMYNEKNFDIKKLNISLVEKSIRNNKGYYLIDWGNFCFDEELEICDWKSLCLTPIVYNEEVIGVIYIDASVNKREYNGEDLYFINYVGQLIIPLLY